MKFLFFQKSISYTFFSKRFLFLPTSPISFKSLLVLFLFSIMFAAQPALADPQWTMVWNDEFNGASGSSPDPTHWTYDTGGGGWGNGELETYTNTTANAYIDGSGHLVIQALDNGGNYTSARMKTQGVFDQAYGMIEASIQLPAGGSGIWPAWWMLGQNIGSVGWPACGEIDMLEDGLPWSNTVIGEHVHGPLPGGADYNGGAGVGNNYSLPSGTVNSGFHTYGVQWSPNQIQFFIDGTIEQTLTPGSIPGGGTYVFNHPFFMLLNLAIGGPSGSPAGVSFPQQMLVDYVRVYKLTDNNTSAYGGTAVSIPGTIQAENFDSYNDTNDPVEPGEGFAYNSLPTNNVSGQYRTGDAISEEVCSDTGGGYDVDYTSPGQWLQYSINVTQSGTYNLDARVASSGQGGTFHFDLDGTAITGEMTCPNTGGWQNWQDVVVSVGNINSGSHKLLLVEDTMGAGNAGVCNFNYVNLSLSVPASPTPTYTNTPTFTPAPPTATPTKTPSCGTLVADFENGTNTDNLGGYITLSAGGTGCSTTFNPANFAPSLGYGLGGSSYGERFYGTIGTQGTCYGPSLLAALGSGTPSYSASAAGQNAEVFHLKISTGPSSGPATIVVGVIPTNGTSSGFQYNLVIPASSFGTDLTETVYLSDMAHNYGPVNVLDTTQLYQLYYEPTWSGNYDITIDQISFTCAATPTPTRTNTPTSTNTPTLTNTFTATSTSTNSLTPTSTFSLTYTSTKTFTSTLTPTNTFSSTVVFTNTPISTNTFTSTATHTNTFSPTMTYTNSNTATATSTKSSTPTLTFTYTPTSTFSFTITNTPVGTWTPLNTATATASNTSTYTGTPTATLTNSFTPTFTPSPTNTLTFTNTVKNTATNTAVKTATSIATSTFTYSFTPTNTGTNTSTPTSTYSFTPTTTRTPTSTWTNTSTYTLTATPSFTKTQMPTSTSTPTFTYSFTATFTATATHTAIPPTATSTIAAGCSGIPIWNGNFVAYSVGQKVDYDNEVYQCIQAHTSEPNWMPSVVPALWKDMGSCGSTPTAALITQNPVTYPNPATSSTVNIQLPLTNATNVKVQVFTIAMREVQTINTPLVIGNTLTVQLLDKSGINLANGLYYFVIQVGGQRWTNKVLVLR